MGDQPLAERPPKFPVLWGDGVHDDTEAVEAILDGKPVVNQRDGKVYTYWGLPNVG